MLRNLIRGWRSSTGKAAAVRQSGAVPYCVVNNRIVFLLITSRRTGRWIFPKGAISSGLTPWDSAAKEALEEAGVVGDIGTNPIGTYQIWDKGNPVDVDLYPLKVGQQFDTWQEMDQRLRHWALLAEVQRLINDRSLSHIAASMQRLLQADLTDAPVKNTV